MREKNLLFKIGLIILILSNVTNCQEVQDTVNLQVYEAYTIQLDDYYNYAATGFNPILMQDQFQQPFTALAAEATGSNLYALCSYQSSLDTKYLIGTKVSQVTNETYNLNIVYYQIQIVNGILTRTELATINLFTIPFSTSYIISANFYSSTSGFIFFNTGNNQQGTLAFTYSEGAINTTSLAYVNVSKSISIQGGDGFIYVIYQYQQFVGLLQYQSNWQSFSLCNQIELYNNLWTIVDYTGSVLLVYGNQSNTLYSFYINFQTQKLGMNQIQIDNIRPYYTAQSLQIFQDDLLLTLTSLDNGSVFIKLKMYQFINGGSLNLISVIESSLYINSSPIYISSDIAYFYDGSSFLILNVKRQSVIFSKELDFNHSVSPYEFINNQAIVTVTSKNDQNQSVYTIYPVQLQRPSFIVQFSIEKEIAQVTVISQQFQQNVTITLDPTSQPITVLKQPQVLLEDIVSSIANEQNEQHIVPIEQYVIGANIAQQTIQGKIDFIGTIEVNQFYQPKGFITLIDSYLMSYQTDGYFATILLEKTNNNQYLVSATRPTQVDTPTTPAGLIEFITCDLVLTSQIGPIDNYGTFTLKGDPNNTIYVPFLETDTLILKTFTPSCSNQNQFAFASDIANSVLFVVCNKQITQYTYTQTPQGILKITSSTVLDNIDGSLYNQFICIKGNLIMAGNTIITGYNYLVNTLYSNSIQIPSGSDSQQIILFSSTFVTITTGSQQLTVKQFSYQNFSSQYPLYLRQIISGQAIATNLQIIPKRNEIEYLFVSSQVQGQYSIYRINNAYSYNQFYTHFTFPTTSPYFPIINSQAICILATESICYQFLEQTSIIYTLNIQQTDYNQNTSFISKFDLTFGTLVQSYQLQTMRDASIEYGVINQNAQTLQQLRTNLQDSNFATGQVFTFNDKQVYNACIYRWAIKQPSLAQIINRLSIVSETSDYLTFTILYNFQVSIYSDKLVFGNGLATVQGDFSSYFSVLEDQASYQKIDDKTFQMYVYIFGHTDYLRYTTQFGVDGTGQVISMWNQQIAVQKFQPYTYPSYAFERLISIGSTLWLFNPSFPTKYQIVLDTVSGVSTLNNVPITLSSILSYNVINSLSLQLSFYRSGQISVTNVQNTNTYSVANLRNLLLSVGIVVDESDQVGGIFQYSDTQFRIQYVDSYIYDITFSLSQSNQLTINKASYYYYKDVFNSFYSGFTGSRYTLLFGSITSSLSIVLYDTSQPQTQYLISSLASVNQGSTFPFPYSVTSVKEVNQFQFNISFSNGYSSAVTINDQVGIKFLVDQQGIVNKQMDIYLRGTDETEQYQFSLSIGPNPYNPSSPSITNSHQLKFLLIFFSALYSLLII